MTVEDVAFKIKKLEIQGATHIALEALNSLAEFAQQYDGADFFGELERKSKLLLNFRPTEPLMQNFIRKILGSAHEGQEFAIQKRSVVDTAQVLRDYLSNSIHKISEIGAKRIPKRGIVFTHCHSSLVEAVLKKAYDDGKKVEVISTETRPKLQGRITAKNLSDYGIPVTQIVDSAMMSYMNLAHLALIGSDAILSDGSVVNKIGSHLVGLAAREADTPLYVCTETYKFDPTTLMGDHEPIEKRDSKEVWENPPDGVQIKNPAFEIIPPDLIHALITEQGIMSPHAVYEVIRRIFAEGEEGKKAGEE